MELASEGEGGGGDNGEGGQNVSLHLGCVLLLPFFS